MGKIVEYGNYCKAFIVFLGNGVITGRYSDLSFHPPEAGGIHDLFPCIRYCAISRAYHRRAFIKEGSLVEKIFYFAGIAGCLGGVALLIYQGLMYLQCNTWTQYTMLFLVEHGPGGVRDQVRMSPQIAGALESCPLFIGLIALGLILLFIGSKISNRYS